MRLNKFYPLLTLIVLIFLSCDENKEEDLDTEKEVITFVKQFGGEKDDNGYAVQQTHDGGYIIIGSTYSFGGISDDVWLIKTDSLGNELWSKTFGGSSKDGGRNVSQTNDLGYIILGQTTSYSIYGTRDIWLIKTDSTGEEEWNKTFGGERYDNASDLIQTSDFGFIFTGTLQTSSFALYVAKTNSEGIEQWSYIDTLWGRSSGSSVIQSIDGGYAVLGTKNDIVYDDIYLLKLNSDGNEEWNKTFGGSYMDVGKSVQQTSDGGYILTGTTELILFEDDDLILIKTDSEGNTVDYP